MADPTPVYRRTAGDYQQINLRLSLGGLPLEPDSCLGLKFFDVGSWLNRIPLDQPKGPLHQKCHLGPTLVPTPSVLPNPQDRGTGRFFRIAPFGPFPTKARLHLRPHETGWELTQRRLLLGNKTVLLASDSHRLEIYDANSS